MGKKFTISHRVCIDESIFALVYFDDIHEAFFWEGNIDPLCRRLGNILYSLHLCTVRILDFVLRRKILYTLRHGSGVSLYRVQLEEE